MDVDISTYLVYHLFQFDYDLQVRDNKDRGYLINSGVVVMVPLTYNPKFNETEHAHIIELHEERNRWTLGSQQNFNP